MKFTRARDEVAPLCGVGVGKEQNLSARSVCPIPTRPLLAKPPLGEIRVADQMQNRGSAPAVPRATSAVPSVE